MQEVFRGHFLTQLANFELTSKILLHAKVTQQSQPLFGLSRLRHFVKTQITNTKSRFLSLTPVGDMSHCLVGVCSLQRPGTMVEVHLVEVRRNKVEMRAQYAY